MPTKSSSSPGSVLLNFRASNYRSFRDEFEFSLLASRVAESEVVREVEWNSSGSKVSVLPAAILYGANASGKSNLLKALSFMRHVVLGSFRHGTEASSLPHHPYVLSDKSKKAPSRFEIELVLDGVRHLYGFTSDSTAVREETWYWWPNGRRTMLLERDGDSVSLGTSNRSKSASAVGEILRDNALYLSTAAALGHPLANDLFAWFTRNLMLAEQDSRASRQIRTVELLQDEEGKRKVLDLIRAADLGIVDAETNPPDPELLERFNTFLREFLGEKVVRDSESELREEMLSTVRLHHESDDGVVVIDAESESLGTHVWLGLVGPLLDALENGAVFLADELDSSLHPSLVREVVRLFQNPKSNPNRAQLIANSHDVSLLDIAEDGTRLLGRDQCWIAEKGSNGVSRLYPLTDFDPRKEESIARRYLKGRYGGLPIVSSAEFTDSVRKALQTKKTASK